MKHTQADDPLSPGSRTGEENNPPHLLVVEEVVERPDTPLFAKRIRRQIWVVAAKYDGVFHCEPNGVHFEMMKFSNSAHRTAIMQLRNWQFT